MWYIILIKDIAVINTLKYIYTIYTLYIFNIHKKTASLLKIKLVVPST